MKEESETSKALRESDDRLRLLRQLVRAQEEERKRISRELHDQFGPGITALSLRLAALKLRLAALKSSDEATAFIRAEIAVLEDIVNRLDNDLDFLVWELRPTGLDDLGLAEALSDYVSIWSKYFDIPASLQSQLTARLPSDMETVLYRIAQEALNNVAKHAQASRVDLVLQRDAEHVSLIVSDNGVGFDTSAPVDPRAMGVLGMRERAGLVAGTVEIDSGPQGTTVHVRVPADAGDSE